MANRRAPETPEEASIALDFARFALSAVGLLSTLGVVLALVVGAMFGMAALDTGPDALDFFVLTTVVTVAGMRHFSVYRRLRASASKALHTTEP